MLIPIQKYFRKSETPFHKQGEFDFSAREFLAFCVRGPVRYTLNVQPEEGTAHVSLAVEASISADCARCLAPANYTQTLVREFRVREEDLADELAELPFTANGSLDVEELVYQEILLEVPGVILCRDDCEGLCQCCGQPKAACQCAPQPVGDPRLQVLRQLLTDDE